MEAVWACSGHLTRVLTGMVGRKDSFSSLGSKIGLDDFFVPFCHSQSRTPVILHHLPCNLRDSSQEHNHGGVSCNSYQTCLREPKQQDCREGSKDNWIPYWALQIILHFLWVKFYPEVTSVSCLSELASSILRSDVWTQKVTCLGIIASHADFQWLVTLLSVFLL